MEDYVKPRTNRNSKEAHDGKETSNKLRVLDLHESPKSFSKRGYYGLIRLLRPLVSDHFYNQNDGRLTDL